MCCLDSFNLSTISILSMRKHSTHYVPGPIQGAGDEISYQAQEQRSGDFLLWFHCLAVCSPPSSLLFTWPHQCQHQTLEKVGSQEEI